MGIVGDFTIVAARSRRPLVFCFIDGGHGEGAGLGGLRGWSPRVALGGLLAIHDVFPDPADGGRPPYELYKYSLSPATVADGLNTISAPFNPSARAPSGKCRS